MVVPPYAVVSFTNDVDNEDDDDDFEITSEVPSCWLTSNKKQCYWPTTKNLNSLILRQIEPKVGNRNWKLHDITFENYYEKLEDARKRAVTISSADENSLPEEEGHGFRLKKFSIVKKTEKNEELISKNSKKLNKIPVPPDYDFINDEQLLHISDISIIHKDKLEGLSLANTVISEYNSPVPVTESDSLLVKPSCSTSQKVYPKVISSVVLTKPLLDLDFVSSGQSSSRTATAIPLTSQSPSAGLSSPTHADSCGAKLITTDSPTLIVGEKFSTPTFSCIRDLRNVEPPTATIRGFIENKFDTLFRKMAEMSVEIQRINQNLEKLQNHSEVTTNTNPIVALINNSIPFNTKEQVMKFEAELVAGDIPKSILVHYLKKIGGNNMKDCTTRILKRIFSNELGTQSTWLRQRNNFKVCHLTVMQCIKDAVFSRFKPTEKEFEDVASEWFRQAKQRLVREIAKATKAV